MKFTKWYEKQRPILVVLSSLWFLPGKFRKPIQQIIQVLDYMVETGGVWIENVNVRE